MKTLLSLNHHLFADDTQLFSFHPHNFDSSISRLQNALRQISSWMTANLLTLNYSEDRILVHRMQKPTCENTQHFIPPTLLEILASYLTNILPSLTKLYLSPTPVAITFFNFAVPGLT